jgi:inosose dehydratase
LDVTVTDEKKIYVANAPVSYGAFELTVGINPNVPDGTALLDAVAAAGYDGIDLGPVGYLGVGADLGRHLADRGLGLSGAYLEFRYHEPDNVTAMMPELDAMLDTFDAVAPFASTPPPRPTIADAGSDARHGAPGSGARNPTSGLTDAEWDQFAVGMNRVLERCRQRGYEPTLHCETGSFLESTAELEKVLTMTDIEVCLETGHQLLGGGDPHDFLHTWSDRVNHVHLKDVTMSVFDDIVRTGQPSSAIWANEAFPRLGDGDFDVTRFVGNLNASGFAGWLVVEQDIFPSSPERFARAIEDQHLNRTYLSTLGL